MISDCQRLGIVKITINRSTIEDKDLSNELMARFKLKDARVVIADDTETGQISRSVASTGAEVLKENLIAGGTVGITWGRTLLSIIEAFGSPIENGGIVVQLAGSVGATHEEFDSLSLVHRLAGLLGARPVHLSAPFIVEEPSVATSLMRNSSNAEARRIALNCDVVIVGVGNLDPQHSTLLNSGHVSREERDSIVNGDAVGEIDIEGRLTAHAFSERVISIKPSEILGAPTRIAVAARPNVVRPLLGALHGGYLTHLIVDTDTANGLLAE